MVVNKSLNHYSTVRLWRLKYEAPWKRKEAVICKFFVDWRIWGVKNKLQQNHGCSALLHFEVKKRVETVSGSVMLEIEMQRLLYRYSVHSVVSPNRRVDEECMIISCAIALYARACPASWCRVVVRVCGWHLPRSYRCTGRFGSSNYLVKYLF